MRAFQEGISQYLSSVFCYLFLDFNRFSAPLSDHHCGHASESPPQFEKIAGRKFEENFTSSGSLPSLLS
jgi:hypothetical protein